MWNIALIGWWVLTKKALQAPSVWFSAQYVGAEGPWEEHMLTLWLACCLCKFPPVMHRLSKRGMRPLEKPYSESRKEGALLSHPLSCLSFLGLHASSVTSHVFFFFLCWPLVANLSHTHRQPTLRECWCDQVHLFQSMTDRKKKSCHQEANNPFLFYFHTHAPFSHSMIPCVWPQGDRCCNGGADHAVSCVTPELILQEIVCSSDLWLTMTVSVTDYNVSRSKGV